MNTVRVLTWNIHGALGRNRRFDLARVVDLIDRWDPQVVALQEVDSRRDNTGENPFELLQRELGEHGIGAKSITTDDGDYGQMLISRWPLSETVVAPLSPAISSNVLVWLRRSCVLKPRCVATTRSGPPGVSIRVAIARRGSRSG